LRDRTSWSVSERQPVIRSIEVRDDESDAGIKLVRMPFDLGDDAALLKPKTIWEMRVSKNTVANQNYKFSPQ
jgi:hypothetical protein